MSSIRAIITKEDAEGDPTQVEVYRNVRHNGRNRRQSIGFATYVEHDGVAERYAVFAGLEQVGVIERQGLRVTSFPDIDGAHSELFSALARVL